MSDTDLTRERVDELEHDGHICIFVGCECAPCYSIRELATIARLAIEQLDALYSEEPCGKCGYGVSARCYGCLAKQAESERDTAIRERDEVTARLMRIVLCAEHGRAANHYTHCIVCALSEKSAEVERLKSECRFPNQCECHDAD